MKEVSKTEKKMHQGQEKSEKQENIRRILGVFKVIRKIPGNKSAKRRVLVTKIKNEKGEVITSRNGIAFGEFYKKIYDDQEHEETEQENEENENESSIDMQNRDTSERGRIPEIMTEELQTAINRLKKKGKPADSNGIRAEDIKACDDETKEMLRQIFNEIVKQNVLCKSCANCARQYCTEEFVQDLTKSKRKIRRDSKLLPNNRPSCDVGNVPQEKTGADIEKLYAQTSTPAIRRSGIADDELRIWNMDTYKRARKNDSIDATQYASTHHTNEKEIQKDRKTKRRDQRRKRH